MEELPYQGSQTQKHSFKNTVEKSHRKTLPYQGIPSRKHCRNQVSHLAPWTTGSFVEISRDKISDKFYDFILPGNRQSLVAAEPKNVFKKCFNFVWVLFLTFGNVTLLGFLS